MANIPLVRTEGKIFAAATTVTATTLASMPVLLRKSKTDETREVETAFDLGDCLYFYAGHACPDFGDIVFVYEPAWSQAVPDSATPFDTGGVYWRGYIHADGLSTDDRNPSNKGYVDVHQTHLSNWCAELTSYLGTYFESPGLYVLGARAKRDDPTGRLLHSENERRAWTWEVRVHQDHPVLLHLRFLIATADFADNLRLAVLSLSADKAEDWNKVLDNLLKVPTDSTVQIATYAERTINACL
jgi:hypothetical protein